MKEIFKQKNILVLAPHTDDGEFGCGGTIARAAEEGAQIYYVAFSAAEQSVLPHLPRDILHTEVKKATEFLGIPNQNLFVRNFPVRYFPSHRQDILEDMVQLQKSIQPDIVFMPSFKDIHQDHAVIAQEGIRAFKSKTIFGYEVPWNNLSFETSCFVKLEERHLQKKIQALAHYESQKHRSYASEEFLRSLAVTRGTQIGSKYCEAFENIRLQI